MNTSSWPTPDISRPFVHFFPPGFSCVFLFLGATPEWYVSLTLERFRERFPAESSRSGNRWILLQFVGGFVHGAIALGMLAIGAAPLHSQTSVALEVQLGSKLCQFLPCEQDGRHQEFPDCAGKRWPGS
jgi:hypothetical protein